MTLSNGRPATDSKLLVLPLSVAAVCYGTCRVVSISAGLLRASTCFFQTQKCAPAPSNSLMVSMRERDNTSYTRRDSYCQLALALSLHFKCHSRQLLSAVRLVGSALSFHNDPPSRRSALTTDRIFVCWLFVQQTCIAATKNKNSNIFTRRTENKVHRTRIILYILLLFLFVLCFFLLCNYIGMLLFCMYP